MARKSQKKEENVEAYRHKTETLKNAEPVHLASYDTAKPKPKKYEYDPYLSSLISANSQFFKLGKENRIAVKVIDHRGNEVMVVREMRL